MKVKFGPKTFLYRTSAIVLIAMMLLAALPTVSVSADSLAHFAGTGADNNSAGTVPWSNPTRIVANDNNYASVTVSSGSTTHYLQGTNFGFAIPVGSTINGIQLTIGRYENNTQWGNDVRDATVSLVKGGVVQSATNKANTSTEWPTSETVATYGSTSDLWGTTWTVADINATNFGAVLSVNSSNNRNAYVDYMQITVSYTLPPTTTVGDGSSPSAKFVKGSETNQAVSAFTLSANVNDTVTGLTFTGSGTGLANVVASGVKLWQDNGSVPNEWDGTDASIATASFSGSTASFSGLSLPATASPTQYLITYDIVASPANAETMAGAVTSIVTAVNPYTAINDNTDATVTVDTVAPTIEIGAPNKTITNSGPVTFTVTYADANFNSSTLAPANVNLITTDTATGTVAVTGTGSTRTVTISSITGNGTLGISIAAGTASDKAGNTAPASAPSATFTVDNVMPTVLSMTRLDPDPTSAASVNWTVTFNKSVLNVGTNDFVLAATGITGASISGVTGTGAGPYNVTANTGSGSGTLGLNIALHPTVQDSAGNALVTGAVGEVYTVNKTLIISGNLGAGAAGQTVLCTSTRGSCPASVVADGTGFYTISLTAATSSGDALLAFSGTVEPVPPSGFYFSPPTRPYSKITSDQINQNYTLHVVSHTTYYVDNTNPACSATGGTTAHPFCTIAQATTAAVAGDTVRVLAGTYAETVKPKFGNPDDPVTFIAGPGLVTITGDPADPAAVPPTPGGAGFRMTQKHDIIIDGFTVTGTVDYGIYSLLSTRLTIRNNHVSYSGIVGASKVGIYLSGTTYSTISGNTSDHNTYHGIQLWNGSSYNTVSNNVSFANATGSTSRATGIDVENNCNYNTVIHNIIYANEDSGLNFYRGTSGIGSSHNQVLGNLSYGNGDHGIDNSASPYNTIIGNTVQGNVTAGINLEKDLSGLGSDHATILNNIVVDNGLNKLVGGGSLGATQGNIRVDSNSTSGTILDYNLYYLSPGGSVQGVWGSTNYATFLSFKAASGQEANGSEGDPLFTSAASIAERPTGAPFNVAVNLGNYHINAGSPAIDNANSDDPEPALDIDGYTRVDDPLEDNDGTGTGGNFYDRGAYEYQATITTLSSNNNPSTYGEVVVFTATVNQAAATGTVKFYDGATELGPGTLNESTPNIATFSISTLAAGALPHSITAVYQGDGVYPLSTSPVLLQTVQPKPVTITPNSGQSKVYSSVDPVFTYTSSDLAATLTGVMERADGEDVGSYAFLVGTLSAGPNYSLSIPATPTFAITPKPITITPTDGQSKVYGTVDPIFTYTPSVPLEIGDAFTGALGRVAGSNVNTYAFAPGTLSAGSNYTLSLAAGHTFAITARPITITPTDGQTKVYGEVDPIFDYTPSETPDVPFTGALGRNPGANVSTYAFTRGTLSAGTNYTLTLASGHTFAITPKPITITPTDGQSKVYGTVDPIFTFTPSSALENGDTFTGALGRVNGMNVDNYAFTLNTVSAGANYILSLAAGHTFAITPKPITVTVDAGQSKMIGTADPTFTYVVSPALEAGDSFTGDLARTAGESLGVYPINLGTLSAGSNYSITFVGADFTVASTAPQTITFGSLSDKILGSADFNVTATATSGLPVTFTSATPSICTVTTGGLVHLVAIGTCTINADQAGDTTYDPAPRVQRSFEVISYKLFLPLIFRQ